MQAHHALEWEVASAADTVPGLTPGMIITKEHSMEDLGSETALVTQT